MKPKVLLVTFEHLINTQLDSCEVNEAHQALNLYHWGERKIPLSVPYDELTEELKNASYIIHQDFSIKVFVDLYSDGTFTCRTQ